ncbi:MAG: hypothetical protein Q8O88_05800, partial [bacterium]|nr:hypothetical protein [bacterium]
KSFKGRGMLFTELKNHLKRPISIFSSFRGRNNRFFYRVADLRCNRAAAGDLAICMAFSVDVIYF